MKRPEYSLLSHKNNLHELIKHIPHNSKCSHLSEASELLPIAILTFFLLSSNISQNS